MIIKQEIKRSLFQVVSNTDNTLDHAGFKADGHAIIDIFFRCVIEAFFIL